jgi:hypothetical protein
VHQGSRLGAVHSLNYRASSTFPLVWSYYRERKKVEWFINLLKQYRRVATRYEKTARNFLGFVHVASIMILLR